jgi:hypothetical protein
MPFKFPTTLDTLDGVPEEFVKLYVQDESGSYALHDDLKGALGAGGNLAESVDKERKRADKAEKELKAWKKLADSPTDLQAKLDKSASEHADEVDQLKKLIDEKGDARTSFEKLKQDMEKSHAKQLADKDAEVSDLRDSLQKHLVESAAVQAITEAKGKVKPLLPTVMGMLKLVNADGDYVVRVTDKDGDPRGDGKGGYLDIKGLISELRDDSDYAPLFESSGISGSGATGRTNAPGGGAGSTPPGIKNPWSPQHRNLTEQMRITKENPTLAAKLQQQAGA